MKNYRNPTCTGIEEFEEDLNRIKYVKRLFGRYKTTGDLKERLVLNHLITFYNVFEIEAATRLLFHRVDEEFQPLLKTFLVFLNCLPEDPIYVQIPLDTKVIQILRSI